MYELIKPILWKIEPETAHNLAIKIIKTGLTNLYKEEINPLLSVKVGNLRFPSPIGLAAGFDKNAEVFSNMFKLGFGFVEVGTITPKPQFGNPKPRIFRLVEDKAIVNRLGFNNVGVQIAKDNIISKLDRFIPNKLGVNIGPNKDSSNRIDDFLNCYKSISKYSDYVTFNLSSPNTPNLRDFESKEIDSLLANIDSIRDRSKDIFIKLSPDLSEENLIKSVEKIIKYGMNGVILTNTTLSRPTSLKSGDCNEDGGLSGFPLKSLSLKQISIAYKITEGKIPIIGVGGVSSATDVIEKLRAGASAVQLYTGMIYEGLGLPKKINQELVKYLENNGIQNIQEIVGASQK